MTGFIIRRLGQAIVVVLGVTLIVFILLHLLPGSLARDILGNRATPQAIQQFNQQNHLDKSFIVQYWYFLDQLIHGNLGYSYQFNRTVDSLLATDLPRDLVLGGLSLIFSLMIAIPTGIAQAVKRNGALDYAGTGLSFLLYSMPQYAIALLLIQFLSITFHVFPAEAPQSTSALGILEHPSGLVLPVLSLTLVTYAAQGAAGATGADAAPAAQLADRGRDPGRPVDPAGPDRDADHRAGVQLPGGGTRVLPGRPP
jgi:peptide/nickel transport system permease protein